MPIIALLSTAAGAAAADSAKSPVRIITLDPGHFHAALVQKSMYPQVDPLVHVYAPAGMDVEEHIKRIDLYNTRADQPTQWKERVYIGSDYFERFLQEKAGNVVVIAGNNLKKTEYIKSSVSAGLNVLADKPMAIDAAGFKVLEEAFAVAKQKKVLLYDIMTERNEITTLLQREFSQIPDVFGTMERGTPDNPAVTKESVHHFYKSVSGQVLKRPAWAFDVKQQGEGVVDVTTHLVDLVQWECFPGQALDYRKDIEILSAKRWPTAISGSDFKEVTGADQFPAFMRKDVKDNVLQVYANGEINYRIRGVHAKVSVIWNFKAPAGAGDMHNSILRGSRSNLSIRQGPDQSYKPTLYIEPVAGAAGQGVGAALKTALAAVQAKYPGVTLEPSGANWKVVIPEKYNVGHEAHFGQVMQNFLQYLAAGKLPDWEVPNMLAKYYTTTQGLQKAATR